MLENRKGTEKDIPELIDLLDYVRNSMEQKEWLFLDPPETIRERMADGSMTLWIAMDGKKIVGAFDTLNPGLEAYNYGYALNLPQAELLKVVNMDTAAVHPDYRGRGLQKQLMQLAEAELASTGKSILLCTVHPENQFSLNNVLSQGYQIQRTVPMYGSIRHILRKNLRERKTDS